MRPVFAYLSLAAGLCFSLPSTAADNVPQPTTLILQFEQPHVEQVLAPARAELDAIMRNAGFTFDLRVFSELNPYAEFSNLIVVKMKGRCRMEANPINEKVGGPLAFTHVSDGLVLPFIEVGCDKVRSSIRPAMWGDQFRRGNELMGRALARVIAHEIYHVITGREHGANGIARHALSGSQLIADRFFFEPDDIERMILSSLPKKAHQ